MQSQLLDLFSYPQTFETFIPLGNEMLCECLTSNDNQFIHIIGSNSSGKTHLLKAWVDHHQDSIYLDHFSQEQIPGLIQGYKHIAIDDVDKLDLDTQIAVFNLFNQIKLANLNIRLLTSSHNNLDVIKTFREDLRTRLLSGIKLHLKALDDEHLLEAIETYCKTHGIKLPNAESKFILSRYPRNLGVLIQAIDKVSNHALLYHKNITIPLIKQALGV